ncbi:hypothetical protein K402DRAFT_467474 [Aulographum hederae CBS 113979]|uniref:Uncharacterized protein n=1 Tax=Aulographum hederae CBS 113979 TaxID=1176131 RepID=A0A6G1GKY6_9PEZI|nr:hypothetical protein K402DRAFT_467474 [Aulographum hederae CBS 113979]
MLLFLLEEKLRKRTQGSGPKPGYPRHEFLAAMEQERQRKEALGWRKTEPEEESASQSPEITPEYSSREEVQAAIAQEQAEDTTENPSQSEKTKPAPTIKVEKNDDE